MTREPKDHLAPGGARRGAEADTGDAGGGGNSDEPGGARGPLPVEREGMISPVPADPGVAAGSPDAAARGKATRSPAEVATRPHLEGSEQGPM